MPVIFLTCVFVNPRFTWSLALNGDLINLMDSCCFEGYFVAIDLNRTTNIDNNPKHFESVSYFHLNLFVKKNNLFFAKCWFDWSHLLLNTILQTVSKYEFVFKITFIDENSKYQRAFFYIWYISFSAFQLYKWHD